MTFGKRVGFCWAVLQPSGVASSAGAAGHPDVAVEPLAADDVATDDGDIDDPVHATNNTRLATNRMKAGHKRWREKGGRTPRA